MAGVGYLGWISGDFKMLFFTKSDISIDISTQEFFKG